jgi:hypothetical protein
MVNHLERAEELRNRGEELRMLGAGTKDETIRQMLLKLADDYNDMADMHDQLAALKP